MFTLDQKISIFRGIIQETAPLFIKDEYKYVSWREEFEDSIRRTLTDQYHANPALIETKLIFTLLDYISNTGMVAHSTVVELTTSAESLKFFYDKDSIRHGMLDYLTIIYRSMHMQSALNTILDDLGTETVDIKDSLLTVMSDGMQLVTLNKGIQKDSIRRNLSDRFTKTVI